VALHGWIKFFAGSMERIAEQSKGSEILNILKELIFDFYDESCRLAVQEYLFSRR
jgi:hypothetical protein